MPHPQLDRLMDNARVHLPGAIDTALQYGMFNVLEEFCRGSLAWRESIDVEVDTTTKLYDVVPSGGTVAQLISLKNASGIPIKATMEKPEVLELKTLPTTAETLVARVAITVVDPVKTDGYPDIPNWILTKYFAAILDGLIGRMHSQPAKPYTNEKLAVYHTRRFRDAMALARSEAMHQNLYAAQSWRFPKFA